MNEPTDTSPWAPVRCSRVAGSSGSKPARAMPRGESAPERTIGHMRVGPAGPMPAGNRRRRAPSQIQAKLESAVISWSVSPSSSSSCALGPARCSDSAPTSTGCPSISTVRTCPPSRAPASNKVTSCPAPASLRAATNPVTPPPITAREACTIPRETSRILRRTDCRRA